MTGTKRRGTIASLHSPFVIAALPWKETRQPGTEPSAAATRTMRKGPRSDSGAQKVPAISEGPGGSCGDWQLVLLHLVLRPTEPGRTSSSGKAKNPPAR